MELPSSPGMDLPAHAPKGATNHPGTSLKIVDPSKYNVREHNPAFKGPSIGAEAYAAKEQCVITGPPSHDLVAHEAAHVVQQ